MDFKASNIRMKKSPTYPRYEAADYGFDPQMDFSRFLEEAIKYAGEEHFEVAPQNKEAGKKLSEEVKKNRKSWKSSLFSWWKANKKSNSSMEPPTSSHRSKPRRGHVSTSSLMHWRGGGSGGGGGCMPCRPTSAILTSVFHPTKRVENEIPYICLDNLTGPHGVRSYGPVYLVT